MKQNLHSELLQCNNLNTNSLSELLNIIITFRHVSGSQEKTRKIVRILGHPSENGATKRKARVLTDFKLQCRQNINRNIDHSSYMVTMCYFFPFLKCFCVCPTQGRTCSLVKVVSSRY